MHKDSLAVDQMKDMKYEKRSGISKRDLEVASNVSPNMIIVATYEPTRNGNGSAEIIKTIAAVTK